MKRSRCTAPTGREHWVNGGGRPRRRGRGQGSGHPYDRNVDPLLAASLGVLAGLLVGSLGVARWARRHTPVPTVAAPPPQQDFEQVVQVMRSAALVTGAHDELLASNAPARSLGVVKGTRIAIPAVLDLVRAARVEQELSSVNLDLVGSSGRPTLQLAVRVVPLAEGRVFVVADDRAPALRMHESTRDFMTNATHELKTPIGAISLLGEAIEEAADDPVAVARFAGKVRAESERVAVLVGQIITLSKLQGQAIGGAVDPVDLDDVVAHSLTRCAALAKSREVDLTVNGEPDLWAAGDSDQLSTAVTNLVQNAIAYSNPRARVVVTTRSTHVDDDDYVEIAVSDNGIGLSADDAKRIFERFYRVDYARSRQTGGTGLGLSIVNEIVQGHGGEVTVWSKLGQGSTFTIRIPAARAPELPAEGV